MTDFTSLVTNKGKGRDDKPATTSQFYRAVWRWHFYAGIFTIPFLVMLAVTALIMLYGNGIETPLGPHYKIAAEAPRKTVTAQAEAAQAAVAQGTLAIYVAPRTPTEPGRFIFKTPDAQQHVVTLNPVTGAVLETHVKDKSWYYFGNHIHGTFFMGDFGDRLIEIAAGFGIIVAITGIYLWWPRGNRRGLRLLFPALNMKGRMLWKELHVTMGFYLSLILILFLVSGMAWTGVWGSQFVQAWSSFPAEKWDNVPLSDKTHANLNHGTLHEVPWGLEQTPLPASGSQQGVKALPPGEVNLNTVVALASQIGFKGQFRVNLPADETGVYTISADSMDHDTENPWQDLTVHIDQYTGKILAKISFADYSLMAKAMAVGIALHQGDMGVWNLILNTGFCLAIIFLCVSGIVMWWKRRPVKSATTQWRLLPPTKAERIPLWPAAILTITALALAFPLMGLVLAVILVADYLLISRITFLKYMFK